MLNNQVRICDPYILPFAPEMVTALLDGRKCSTTRSKRIGHAGDIFVVAGLYGVHFRIISVARHQLQTVADFHFREEGFKSTEEFITFWKESHRGRFTGHKEYFVYRFAPVLDTCILPMGSGGVEV